MDSPTSPPSQGWSPVSSRHAPGQGASRTRVVPYTPESATSPFKVDQLEEKSPGRRIETEGPEILKEAVASEGRRVHNYGGGDVYDGEWGQGKRHGQGKMVWNNGQEYEGEWYLDSMHGEGVYRWPDGQVYEGQFKNGEREGLGTLKLGDGQTKYVGSFVGIPSCTPSPRLLTTSPHHPCPPHLLVLAHNMPQACLCHPNPQWLAVFTMRRLTPTLPTSVCAGA
jgi:hypothetical protein